MPERHHFNPNHHNEPQPVAEITEAPRFASRAEQDAYVEKIFAERQAARASAKAEQAPALDLARKNLQEYFANNGRKRDEKPVNPPRIARPPEIVRLPQIARPPEAATEPIPVAIEESGSDDALEAAEAHLKEVQAERADDPTVPMEVVNGISSETQKTVIEETPPKPEQVSDESAMIEDAETIGKLSRHISAMADELGTLESKKNGRVDAATAELTRVRQGLDRLSRVTGRITDRDVALRVTRDLEASINTMRGIQSAEQGRTDIGNSARSYIARMNNQTPEADQRLDAGLNELQSALRMDDRGHTAEEAAIVDILRHTTRTAEDIYGCEPREVIRDITKIIDKLEQQRRPKGTATKLMAALESIKESL